MGILESSWGNSPFPAGQAPFCDGRFRAAPLADHWLTSDPTDRGVPFACEPLVATVVVDELDEVEETDDDELVRDKALRGANMSTPPRTSSGFIRLFPLNVPHAGREICEKFGGFATAVMRKAQRMAWVMNGEVEG